MWRATGSALFIGRLGRLLGRFGLAHRTASEFRAFFDQKLDHVFVAQDVCAIEGRAPVAVGRIHIDAGFGRDLDSWRAYQIALL